MTGPLGSAENHIDPLTSAVSGVAHRHPGLYIGEAGDVSSDKAINKMVGDQLGQAGTRSLPLTLLILVLVFGSLVAAAVPLMLGLMSVIATIGLVDLLSHLTPIDPNVQSVVMLVGLAVGGRLFAVLPSPRARGARRRTGRAGRPGGGRGDVRTCGARVRRDGDDRDGRDAPVRRSHVYVVLDRDDDRRRRGNARLAHGRSGSAGRCSGTESKRAGSRCSDDSGVPAEAGAAGVAAAAGGGRGGGAWPRVLRQTLAHPAVTAVGATAVLLAMAVPVLHIHTAQSGAQGFPETRRRSGRSTGSRRRSAVRRRPR